MTAALKSGQLLFIVIQQGSLHKSLSMGQTVSEQYESSIDLDFK